MDHTSTRHKITVTADAVGGGVACRGRGDQGHKWGDGGEGRAGEGHGLRGRARLQLRADREATGQCDAGARLDRGQPATHPDESARLTIEGGISTSR